MATATKTSASQTASQAREAAEELQRALQDDPLNATLHFMLAMCFLVTGKKQEAFAQIREALEMNQRHVWSMVILALDYFERGMNAEALAWTERANSIADWDPVPIGLYAALLERGGEPTRVNKVMEPLRDDQCNGAPLGLLVFHLLSGGIDEAVDDLGRAMDRQCALGSLIHLLLIAAVIVLIVNLITGRRTVI